MEWALWCRDNFKKKERVVLICVDLAPRQPGGKGSECRVADIRSFRLRDSCKQHAKHHQLLLSLKYLGWGPT